MSVSKLRRGRARAVPENAKRGGGSYVLPPTVSREALLDGGSDRKFRTLISDLFTIATRMQRVREHLGRRIGISGPQYSLMVAVAHLQNDTGVSVGTVAQALHVSSAFVASETGRMARRGLLLKRTNPHDRRGVLLSLAPAGRLKIDRLAAEIRAVNDLFFGGLDARSFAALSVAAAALVTGSSKAVQYLDAMEKKPRPALKSAG